MNTVLHKSYVFYNDITTLFFAISCTFGKVYKCAVNSKRLTHTNNATGIQTAFEIFEIRVLQILQFALDLVG